MAAGVFGYLGYDMVRLMERLPADQAGPDRRARRHPDPPDHRGGLRRGAATRSPWSRRCARSRASSPSQAHGARRRAADRRWSTRSTPLLDKTPPAADLAALDGEPQLQHHAATNTARWWRRRRSTSAPATSSRSCCRSASRRRSRCRRSRSTARCAASTRRRSCVYLDFGDFSVVGSSPEILVRLRDGKVTIRPIAGTRPRGATPAEDQALEDELLADPKERAEHLMLLDLGRNDVGRVAEIGSVTRHRPVLHRALQPRHAHRLQRRGAARPQARRARRAGGGLPGRHGVGRAQGARDGDHRRAGEGEARPLCRLRRLFRRRRRHGHLHRAAHRAGQGRPHVRAGRRRHRRTTACRRASRPNASTRPRRCSAPPRRRAASPPGPAAGSDAVAGRLARPPLPSPARGEGKNAAPGRCRSGLVSRTPRQLSRTAMRPSTFGASVPRLRR